MQQRPSNATEPTPLAGKTQRNLRFRRQTLGLALVCVLLGLLIWAKLQMLVSVPRTVIADPKDTTAKSIAR